MSIVAVVVTYNRKRSLIDTLKAIDGQTVKPSHIVLIDNNSDDGTNEVVANTRLTIDLRYERLAKNIGGGGGFKIGMQRAHALGADWLWCMDDDCTPHPDALEKLVSVTTDNSLGPIGFLASRVLWVDGSPCLMNLPVAHRLWIEPHDTNHPISRIVGSSFVSILVSRNAVDLVGFPVAEFFIWFDDAEYSRRISKAMPAYLVSDSLVTHHTPKNYEPLAFAELNHENLWKFCYGVRNECSVFMHTDSLSSALLFIAKSICRMSRVRLALKFWPPILKACVIGLFFNYPKYIEYPNPEKR